MEKLNHEELMDTEVMIRLPQRIGKVSFGKDQAVTMKFDGEDDNYSVCILKADGSLANPMVNKLSTANANTFVRNATALYNQSTGEEN